MSKPAVPSSSGLSTATPSAAAPPRTIRIDLSAKSMLMALAFAAGTWVAIKLLPALLVLLVALFIVGTLNPLVDRLTARRVGRGSAIAIVFVTMLVVVAGATAVTLPALIDQVTRLVGHEPELRGRAVEWLGRSRFTASLAASLRDVHYDVIAKAIGGTVLAFSERAMEIFAYAVSSVFLALYLMLDRNRVRAGVFSLVPRRHHLRSMRILGKLQTIVGGYIRGQVITSALMTVFTFVLLTACGVEGALALAVFAGLADVLPYIGVFLSVGPAAAAAAGQGVTILVIVVAVMLAYEELESRVLVPKIYGDALRLPASVVMFALIAGGTLMGILGALLALPAAAALRMLMVEFRDDLPGAGGEDRAPESARA